MSDNPSLYDIHKSFNIIQVKNDQGKIIYNGVKGEHNLRMIMFTNFILGKKCIALLGSRSSGKTNIMKVVGSYASNPMSMDKASEKADLKNEELIKASHLFVPEINKINNNQIEMLKDFGEGATSVYKWHDVTFKRTREIKIPPKPFVTALADENAAKIGEELMSRLTTLTTDSSTMMNEAVIKDKFEKAATPFKKLTIDQSDVVKYQMYVHALPNIDDITFVYIAGKAMIKAIPKWFSDSRRDTDKFLGNTYAITLFHYYDRIVQTKRNKKIMFVTPEDMWYNHIIYHDVLVQSALKCSHLQKRILDILLVNKNERPNKPYMKVTEIHKALIHQALTVSVSNIESQLDSLYKNGYIYKSKDGVHNTYEMGDEDTLSFNFDIDWNEIVEACKSNIREHYPEIADEYIKRFCGNEIICTHPFTGEKINILNQTTPIKQSETKVEKPVVKPLIQSGQSRLVVKQDTPKTPTNAEEYMEVHNVVDCIELETKFNINDIKRLITLGVMYEKQGKYYKM